MTSVSLPTLVEETMVKVRPTEINITSHLLPMNIHLHEVVETGRKISEIKNLLDAAEINRLQTSHDNDELLLYEIKMNPRKFPSENV